MLDKLKDLDLRYEDLESQLGDPRVYGDAEKLRQVNRELKELLPVVETYRAYQAADSRRREAEELLHDPEMKEMAQDELAEAKEELEQLKEKLTILLLPRDPNDSRNVILEIRGGVGGEESACLPIPFCGCIPCTPRATVGSWRSPASTKRSLAA